MGFNSAWVWSNSKTESDLKPRTGWRGCGCQLLAGWILWGSGHCLSPGGREGSPFHHRHIPGEGTHQPLLCLGAKGWAWAHHLRCHIWKEPGQPHWQPPACLGLPKSAERVKVLTGLILSGQTAVVMWGWAVCAATHHKEERREKKREKKMLDIYGSRSQREGILRVGWQFVVLIALSNSC